MTEHEVRLSTKHLPLTGIDLDFDVKQDGRVLGTLSVSSGGLTWRPKSYQKKNGWKASWTQFDTWIRSGGG